MATVKENTKKVTYLDLISQSQKDVEKQQLVFRAEEAKHEVSGKVLETKKLIASKRIALESAKRAVPYNIQTEMELTYEIESLEQGLSFAEKILAERF